MHLHTLSSTPNKRTTSARSARKTVTACTLLRVALSSMRAILAEQNMDLTVVAVVDQVAIAGVYGFDGFHVESKSNSSRPHFFDKGCYQ
jgi:hypothetical protein